MKLTTKQETSKHNLKVALLQLTEIRAKNYGDRQAMSDAADNGDETALRLETAISKLNVVLVDLFNE